MKEAMQELFKRTSTLMIVLGAILLLFGAAGDIVIGTFVLKLPDIIWKTAIGIVGLVLIGFSIYLVWQESIRAKLPPPNHISDVPSEPQQSRSSNQAVFLNEWPPSYLPNFENAEELWLVGVSLKSEVTPTKDFNILKDKLLKKGHSIKALLTDPEADQIIESAVQRSFKETDLERKRGEIRNTLRDLCALSKLAPGRLKIRTIRYPLSYGVYAMNPEKHSGAMYIKLYPYKMESVKPRFVLRASHDEWYESFRQEMYALWNDGDEWNC